MSIPMARIHNHRRCFTLTPRSVLDVPCFRVSFSLQEEVRFTRLKGLMESSKMYRKMAPPDGKASDFCGAGADEHGNEPFEGQR